MEPATLRQSIARNVKRLLSEAGLNPSSAARVMGVNRKTIYRWMAGEGIGLDELEELCRVTAGSLSLEIGNEKAAPPEYWARRLREDAAAISALLVPSEELTAAQLGVAATLPLPDGESGEDRGAGAPESRGPRNRRGR